jgi:3',5'-cyclic AMP phosphodiesterase CpdA
MRIIHISDPHLSSLEDVRFAELRGKRLLGYQSWYRKRRHQYQMATLQQVTQAIVAESADLVIVSGDLVHIGLESEMREAREWLATLGGPDKVLVTPGNHDCYHPESWSLVQRWYQPYLGPTSDTDSSLGPEPADAYPVLRHMDGISIVAACSAAPAPWWAASGALGDGQRERLRAMLDSQSSHMRFLVLHHPPLPGMAVARKALTDAHELQVILEATAPEVTLHGHLHRNGATAMPYGRIFCTAPPSSARTSTPASYRVFDVSAERDGWQIRMTLKSLIGGAMEDVEETHWKAIANSNSLDPRQSNEAGAQ